MKKLFTLLLIAGIAVLTAAPVIRQNVFVGWSDKGESAFSRFPDQDLSCHRMAYPWKNRAVLIDCGRVLNIDRIVFNLSKVEKDRPETSAGVEKIMVWAGKEKNLTLCSGVKFSSTVKEAKEQDTVILTGLPPARYYIIYVPWTRPVYVFGFADAAKDVEVWSGDPAMELNSALPSLMMFEDGWDKDAIPVASAGLQDGVSVEQAATHPYNGSSGGTSAAYPWKNRIMEFALASPQVLTRIVMDLDKLNTTRPETEPGMKDTVLYVSDDGRKFRSVPFKYDVKYYQKDKVLFARVTLSGKFPGKYFRIATPWNNSFYVYRFNGFATHVKPFGLYSGVKFSVPLCVTKLFTAFLSVNAPGQKAEIFADGQLLWQGILPETMPFRPEVNPKTLATGVHTLRLVIHGEEGTPPFICEEKFFYAPYRIVLSSEPNSEWKDGTYNTDAETVSSKTALKNGAALTYTVPTDGKFALYAGIRGRKSLRFTVGEKSELIALQMEHPGDRLITTAGDSFIGLYEFKKGEKVRVTAPEAGCEIMDLFLVPVSDESFRKYFEKAEKKPSVILHSDGYSDFFFHEITKDSLEKRAIAFKAANAFAMDWCIGTSAVNYPSKIATMYGKQRNPVFFRNGDRLASERVEKLLKETNSDPIRILRDKTRELGLRFSVTVRADAWYNASQNSLNAQYFLDHPEWGMVYADGRKDTKPSYAYKGVRDFYLTVIKEVAAYHPDAVVIEFLRHPPFFGYDAPLVEACKAKYGNCTPADYLNENWQKLQAEIMTAWLREVRKAIDAVDPKIALEINFDWKDYYRQGIDVRTLLKEGLIDVISPGVYNAGTHKFFTLKPFMEMVKASPRKVLVFPRIEATIYGGDITPAEEKGLERIRRRSLSDSQFLMLMHDFAAEGADGLRPFNAGGEGLALELADRTLVRNFNTWIRPMLDVRRELK